MTIIANALGAEFGDKDDDPMDDAAEAPPAPSGMSIRELGLTVKPPVAGGETLRASLEVLRLQGAV